MVLTEKNILVPEGLFSANTVLFMYIALKQSPGHMPVPQPGTWVDEKGRFWQLWIWLQTRQSWVGSKHTVFQSQRRKRGVQRYGRAGHHLVTATISWWEGGRDGTQGNSSCMEMQKLFRKEKE